MKIVINCEDAMELYKKLERVLFCPCGSCPLDGDNNECNCEKLDEWRRGSIDIPLEIEFPC